MCTVRVLPLLCSLIFFFKWVQVGFVVGFYLFCFWYSYKPGWPETQKFTSVLGLKVCATIHAGLETVLAY